MWDTQSLGLIGRSQAWVSAHTGWFVHVDPDSVNIDLSLRVEGVLDLLIPLDTSVGMTPVWEHCDPRPKDSSKVLSAGCFKENIHLHAFIEGRIGPICDSRIHHQHVPLLVAMEVSDDIPHSLDGKAFAVKGKDSSVVPITISVHIVSNGIPEAE